MTYDILAVNAALRQNRDAAIHAWEEAYRQQVTETARAIAANRAKSPVVLLAGPSGSGKTTTATRLTEALGRLGLRAHLLSMDNYFLPRNDPDFPRLPDGGPDLESPLCLDIPLLNEHFALLETGGDIYVPIYDFPTHSRLEGRTLHMDASHGDVFVFEGIHALNPLFTEKHPHAYRVYVSPEDEFVREGVPFCGPIAMRLMRRCTRDYLFRGATAAYSLGLWDNVIHGENQYILPFRASAHTRITTTLPHELGVLKPFSMNLFRDLPADVPCGHLVDEVLTLLQDVDPIPAGAVPKDSILKEFIGD